MRFPASFSLLLLSGWAGLAPAQERYGEVIIDADRNVTGISVRASSADLENLASLAFDAHGAYRRVASGAAYNFAFTQIAANQVRIEVTRGATDLPVYSEVVAGSSARNALLRAADVAVAHTSKLRGFFAGRLAFVSDRGAGMEIMTSDLFGGEAVRQPTDRDAALGARRTQVDFHQLSEWFSGHLCVEFCHAGPGALCERARHQHRRALQPGWRPGRNGAERRGQH
jgi:TolB protein